MICTHILCTPLFSLAAPYPSGSGEICISTPCANDVHQMNITTQILYPPVEYCIYNKYKVIYCYVANNLSIEFLWISEPYIV